MKRRRGLYAVVGAAVVVGLLAVAFAVSLGGRLLHPGIMEEEVRSLVVSTIQREAPASFFVTGYLDISATTTVENTKYFLPDLLRFNLGTTTATVRLPGRVSYGFDVRQLRRRDIKIAEEGVVEITLPQLSIYSVEPDLERMEVKTDVGWARTHEGSGQKVEQQALQHTQQVLRRQAEQHLKTSAQPRIHTARAIETMLRPVLGAAGMHDPQFRFRIGPDLVLEPRE
ncbi:MAG TPA: DUF4230 domain-containing protein [Rhodothermales bacterium]|nr:DUF4230 domain-containing protein [Rhodothermales bacterium]